MLILLFLVAMPYVQFYIDHKFWIKKWVCKYVATSLRRISIHFENIRNFLESYNCYGFSSYLITVFVALGRYSSNFSSVISIIKRVNRLLDGSFETFKRYLIVAMSLIFSQMPNAGQKLAKNLIFLEKCSHTLWRHYAITTLNFEVSLLCWKVQKNIYRKVACVKEGERERKRERDR